MKILEVKKSYKDVLTLIGRAETLLWEMNPNSRVIRDFRKKLNDIYIEINAWSMNNMSLEDLNEELENTKKELRDEVENHGQTEDAYMLSSNVKELTDMINNYED